MSLPVTISAAAMDIDKIATFEGRVAVFLTPDGKLDQAGRRVNKLTRGALLRFAESESFEKLSAGEVARLSFPVGLAATALDVVKLARRPDVEVARKSGAALGARHGTEDLLALAGATTQMRALLTGLALRAYRFEAHKTKETDPMGAVTVMVSKPEDLADDIADVAAIADGVFFTRDLVNEPANVLTTSEFANRLAEMTSLGLDVEVLEESALEKLGMRTLLGVGQGSESPSKVVVMQWNGGGDEKPFALIGKGVVFDTGGISIKPAGGMEEMTMDMGGAGVVAGAMRTLALRKAKANVVGLVGLVENMPDGKAQRPGDVVTSMKGDTVEVINTDAEGRLVLADVLWYAQERFEPSGMIDLATLTGAIIIGLGYHKAGVFSNHDGLCGDFLKAADGEGEGAWRMPLAPAYDQQLKSRIADMMNVGGRPGGSITAAQFLQRFVKEDVPWIHLDIAGVALPKGDVPLAPKGASGWGVRSIDRLIREKFET